MTNDDAPPIKDVEAWHRTVKALDGLVDMADGLMIDPLIMILGEALARSREELRQAEGSDAKRETK